MVRWSQRWPISSRGGRSTSVCGEGADAVRLARQGWDVTALDVSQARAHGFDPAEYVSPSDLAALLGDGWHVEVDEQRPRDVRAGAGAHHTHDLVLRAVRLIMQCRLWARQRGEGVHGTPRPVRQRRADQGASGRVHGP